MNVASFFSGVGGLDLGLERAGMRVVSQCEADPWRRRVLAERFPGVPISDDVREASMGGLKKLTQEQADEAVRCYDAGESCATVAGRYGVTRQAMWDLLHRRTTMRPRERKGADNGLYRGGPHEGADRARNLVEKAMARGDLTRPDYCSVCGDPDDIQAHHDDYNAPLDVRWLCRRCHFAWHKTNRAVEVMPANPTVDVVVGGVPLDPVRTGASPGSEPESKAAGPASSSTGQTGSQMSLTEAAPAGSCLKTSLGSSPLPTDATSGSFSQRWPTSGTAWRGAFSTLDSSESPSGAVECSLSAILEATADPRYALSARAAKGILRRASARGRALPPELEAALRGMAG